MLASVYSYRVMVKSVSCCCVRGRWVLSNPVTYMLFKNTKSTKELKETKEYRAVLNLNNIVCVATWPLVMYSDFFEIISIVDFILARTRLI